MGKSGTGFKFEIRGIPCKGIQVFLSFCSNVSGGVGKSFKILQLDDAEL